MKHSRLVLGSVATLCLIASSTGAQGQTTPPACGGLPATSQIRQLLWNASRPGNPFGDAGGLFNGRRMWGAVVNRQGVLCAFATTATVDPTNVWPGSQSIAKAKAFTANAYSQSDLPLSTARLYTFAQPGHSLFSVIESNPFDPECLAPASGPGGGVGRVCAGQIFFGGGVPLYRDGRIVGGLGVSGGTSCEDHEVAKRVRDLAGLNPPGGRLVDDIVYSPPDPPSVFAHPVCPNTRRNNVFIGDEHRETYPKGP
jgi:uncharacterized protein GlcG (DUF336 family)